MDPPERERAPDLRRTHLPTRVWPMKSHLTTDQWDYMQVHMPELELRPGAAGLTRLNHPVSAIERAYVEQLGVEKLAWQGHRRIHDVGGAVGRHANRLQPDVAVWCTRPVLTAEDAVKNLNYRDAGYHHFCDHLAQDCNCNEYDAALSVHSLYYLDPEDVATIIDNTRSGVFVAVHHVFDQALDHWWPCGGEIVIDKITPTHKYQAKAAKAGNEFEASYVILGDQVEMTVRGQSTVYRHSALNWLRQAAYPLRDGRTLVWQIERIIGHTQITDFRVVHQAIPIQPEPTLDLGVAVRDPSYYGGVSLKGASAGVEKNVPHVLTHMRSHGQYFTTVDGIVPKALLTEIRTAVAGFERTPETLQRCIDLAGKLLRDSNVPSHLKPRAKILTGYAAFLADIDLEAHMLLGVRARDGDVAHFNQTLKATAQLDALDCTTT